MNFNIHFVFSHVFLIKFHWVVLVLHNFLQKKMKKEEISDGYDYDIKWVRKKPSAQVDEDEPSPEAPE